MTPDARTTTSTLARPHARVSACLVAAVFWLGGCSQGAGSCAAPTAEAPATVAAGETLTVLVDNLWVDCHDTGRGEYLPMGTVEVEAFPNGDPGTVVAESTAEVASDATAIVRLAIPSDAQGTLVIRLGNGSVTMPALSADPLRSVCRDRVFG